MAPSDSHQVDRFISLITRDTLALVLAGGRGTRLGALTRNRVKPAVPFAGSLRLVDFPLSNCVNSGIRRIGVLTQYKAHSLIQHIQRGWTFFRSELGEFVELLPAQQRTGEGWYQGTADAVHQNADIIRSHAPQFLLVLSGDHVYRMDYGSLLAFHVTHGADATVACMPVSRSEAQAFGVMAVDPDMRVRAFLEKPSDPPAIPDQPGQALASMGIYVFNAEYLLDRLAGDALDPQSGHDFGHDIIPRAVAEGAVFGYPYRDPATGARAYWRDVGTLDSYWEANLELLEAQPELNLYDRDWPIWTYQETAPPAKFVHDDPGCRGMALNAMVAGGCIVSGSTVRRSVLFPFVHVGDGSTVEDSVILPGARIGRDCHIRRAVVDADCLIPDGTRIGIDPASDCRRYETSPGGVVLVTPEMLGPQNP